MDEPQEGRSVESAVPLQVIDQVRPSVVQWMLAPDVIEQIRSTADITPVPGVPTTGFNGHAGEVMASPRVFVIYWGRDYGSPTTGMNARSATLDGFFSTVMNSTYLDMLGQYLVGRGTFVGSTWIDHSPARAQSFSFDQLRDVLISWIDAGLTPVVPASNELDLLFVVFPPTEVTLTDNGGTSGGFCGYHWFGHYHNSPFQKANLFFAVADTTSGTDVVAHELAEAFTDRSLNGWFSDVSPNPEIGDVCSSCGSQTLTLAGFPVASYWLVDRGRCLQQSDLTPAPSVAVPRVVGQRLADAVKTLRTAGFIVVERNVVDHSCNEVGNVISQLPNGGTLPLGSPVTIFVGSLPPHPCP